MFLHLGSDSQVVGLSPQVKYRILLVKAEHLAATGSGSAATGRRMAPRATVRVERVAELLQRQEARRRCASSRAS